VSDTLVNRKGLIVEKKDIEATRNAVRDAYSEAARRPRGSHPFPVGRRFAKSVGYPVALLKTIPKRAVESFSGVSNVSVLSDIPEGITVLDLGCGAGLDAIVASRRVGPRGRVVAVDFSSDMVRKARRAIEEAGADNIDVTVSGGEHLPLDSGSVDLALVNGIFNLNPERGQLFQELARVVKTGGTLWSAEIILKVPLTEAHRQSEAAWFA
jgi:arsenite methyltransferase